MKEDRFGKEHFEKSPWIQEQFEIEREILKQQASVETVYERVLRRIERDERLD